MTIALVDGAAYAASVLAPATGDAATQAVFSAGLQNLADRTNYLYQQSKKGGSGVPAGVPKVTSTAALAALATPSQGDMAVLYDTTNARATGVYVFVGSLPRGASNLAPEYIVSTGGSTGAWVLCGWGEDAYATTLVNRTAAPAQTGSTVGAAAGVGSEITLTLTPPQYVTARAGDTIEVFADIGILEYTNTGSVQYNLTISVNNASTVTDTAFVSASGPVTASGYVRRIVPTKCYVTLANSGTTTITVRCYWAGSFSGTRAIVGIDYITASLYR